MTPLTLESKIEAILFWKGEPINIGGLMKATGEGEDAVKVALQTLEQTLQGRGVTLIYKDDEVMMATAPSTSALIEKLTKEELAKDIGKAGLETLSIVLYRSPVTRREIDWIRGVNSTFILRNLLIRGLVLRVENEKDARSFLYKPTFELLSYLGIKKIEQLPNYENARRELEVFEKEKQGNDFNSDEYHAATS